MRTHTGSTVIAIPSLLATTYNTSLGTACIFTKLHQLLPGIDAQYSHCVTHPDDNIACTAIADNCAELSYMAMLSIVIPLTIIPSEGARFQLNQLPGCPMGTSPEMALQTQLKSLFPGLFHREDTLDGIGNEMFRTVDRRVVRKLDKVTDGGRGTRRTTYDCCESVEEIVQPLVVEHEGQLYDAVHLPDSPQLITTGTCVTVSGACGLSGSCQETMGYTWLLIYDLALSYSPPVRFVPLLASTGCRCIG